MPSDAIDKLAYLALTDDGVGMSREDFRIAISADKQSRTLTVSDSGMGMTREELESNLGTIARSGSRQFKEEMEEAGDIDIIGQFGVGFYSAFMVSSQVTVVSRAYGQETAYKWISNGAEGYTITECEKDDVGTDVIMTIKEDTEEEKYSQYLEAYRISALVKKYSDYIRYPVRMEMEHSHVKEGSPEDKPEYETVTEEETLNSMVPIWQRTKAEVTDEELSDFYKEKFGSFEDPLATIQVNAEGAVTYKALLFIPARTPYDYYTKEYKKGLQLYSSGVLIMDSCEDLLPEHFRFVKGVVDTQDISLNISREMLQHTRQMKVIAGALEKRIKTELKKMLDTDREKYETFFKNFGLQLKYGTVGEYGMNKELLRDLLIFETSTQEKPATLSEYVSRMPEQQKHIYYAAGESKQRILSLPAGRAGT